MTSSSLLTITNYDLVISHSWNNPNNKDAPEHGVCGHTFEMIEYFWLLKNKYNCCLLWTETMSPETLTTILESKYNFDEKEIEQIVLNSIFKYRPKLLKAKNILLVDGQINRDVGITMIYNHLFLFSCGNKDNHLIGDPKITVLQDTRIYKDGPRVKHYVKKLLLHRHRFFLGNQNTSMLYLSKNCRASTLGEVEEIMNHYNYDVFRYPSRHWLIVTDDPERYKELDKKKFNYTIEQTPVLDLHKRFNHYVYTPTPRQFDCSNRLLVECRHMTKMVSMWKINQDYLTNDVGLNVRIHDIRGNSEDAYLDNVTLIRGNEDEIFKYIKEEIIL